MRSIDRPARRGASAGAALAAAALAAGCGGSAAPPAAGPDAAGPDATACAPRELDPATCTAPAGGDLRVAILLVDRPGAAVACTADQVRARVVDAAASVPAFYRELSGGALELSIDAFGPLAITGEDLGTAADCGFADKVRWADQADAAAVGAGVALATYDRVVYAMARPLGCLNGFADAPSGRAWIFGPCDRPMLYAHELGHTLTLSHAASPDEEYGDPTDVMGTGYAGLNGPHRLHLGWSAAAAGRAIGRHALAPLEAGGEALVIGELVVSYRGPIGVGARLDDDAVAGASVHQLAPCVAGEPYPPSVLLGVLGDGEVIEAGGLAIAQVAHDEAAATIEIGGGDGCE